MFGRCCIVSNGASAHVENFKPVDFFAAQAGRLGASRTGEERNVDFHKTGVALGQQISLQGLMGRAD
jgi:hypothetical protein